MPHVRKHPLTSLSATVFAAATLLAGDSAPVKRAIPVPEAPKPLSGALSDFGGLRVLELWGSPADAGYAHGYLMAEDMVSLFDEFILDERILPNTATYEAMLIPNVRRMYDWPKAAVTELEAMLRGVRDRLGEQACYSEKLGRTLRLEDLMIANTMADWFGFLCSSFSAWGSLTADGETITARNLDFPYTPSMIRAQIVLVRRNEAGRRSWIGVTWPGLIGVYTGFNDAGVTMLMHDAAGLPSSESVGFTPRSLTTREALEHARPESFLDDALAVLRSHRVLVGNNIHVSGPRGTLAAPAAVFEYDANARDNGVTVRKASDHDAALANALWCTNHMCLRRDPVESWRYEKLDEQLRALANRKTTIDAARAFDIIENVRQRTTLHTVVLELAKRRLHLRVPAINDQTVTFNFADWLAGGRLAASAEPAEGVATSAAAAAEGATSGAASP